MFSSRFKEGLTSVAILPDDSSVAFKVFSKWLYLSVTTHPKHIPRGLFSFEQTSEVRWKMLETIIFADKYCLDELSDMVMSSWIEHQDVTLSLDELKNITSFLVANSSKLCKARDFFAFIWASAVVQNPGGDRNKLSGVDLDTFLNDKDFAKQVLIEVSCIVSQTNSRGRPACDYHLHNKSARCLKSNLNWNVPSFEALRKIDLESLPGKKRKLT